MGNFSIALSGLQADSVALNTIGNNLANLNTTAFKGQTTSFEDLFYQQIGQSGSATRSRWELEPGFRERALTLQREHLAGLECEFGGHGVGRQWILCGAAGRSAVADTRGQLSVELERQFDHAGRQQVMGYAAVNGVVNQNSSLTPITIPVGLN